MPDVKVNDGATVFEPTQYEIIRNNRNKLMRKEHEQLLLDMAELKQLVYTTNEAKCKAIRRARGKY